MAGKWRQRSHQLGKLRSFVVVPGADLGERWGISPVGIGCFHRVSPLFPARSGVVVVRCWLSATRLLSARSIGRVTAERQSDRESLPEYQMEPADERRQAAAEHMAEQIRRTVDEWPPLSAEQRARLALLLRPSGARPPSDYTRWRVRHYCGHVEEIKRLRSEGQPERGAQQRCAECGKYPSVIVAFEPLDVVDDRIGVPRSPSTSRRTKAELEKENASLRAEIESLRSQATNGTSPG